MYIYRLAQFPCLYQLYFQLWPRSSMRSHHPSPSYPSPWLAGRETPTYLLIILLVYVCVSARVRAHACAFFSALYDYIY